MHPSSMSLQESTVPDGLEAHAVRKSYRPKALQQILSRQGLHTETGVKFRRLDGAQRNPGSKGSGILQLFPSDSALLHPATSLPHLAAILAHLPPLLILGHKSSGELQRLELPAFRRAHEVIVINAPDPD